MRLKNKVAVVVGGSRGIGKGIALKLTQEGAHVIITARNVENLNSAKSYIEKKCDAQVDVAAFDVMDEQSARANIDSIDEKYDGIDILVNCAGIINRNPFLEIKQEDFDRVMGVDLRGTFICSQQVARHMKRRGIAGSIINIGSGLSRNYSGDFSDYGACKAAVEALTACMALSLGRYGIRANCIAPGITATEMNAARRNDPQVMATWLSKLAISRLAQPEDIANVVVFFCTDEASYITGQTIDVDGGWQRYF